MAEDRSGQEDIQDIAAFGHNFANVKCYDGDCCILLMPHIWGSSTYLSNIIISCSQTL